ncbi:MAG TPA: TIM barrel protein [Anaerolineales bacterium]|jgi:sugar phosphate isomerase/epimerase
MEISICSYSFHGLLESGKQDVFGYIRDSRALGCTSLDLWNAHLPTLLDEESRTPDTITPEYAQLSKGQTDYLDKIKAAADEAGLPFASLAVDGAHIYEEEPDARRANRIKAYRWMNIAERLGAQQVRLDTGGPEEMPEPVFEIIIDGYADLIKRAGEKGLEVVMENHWGASRLPENVVRILETVKGLGLLFDTGNWPDGAEEKGWAMCAKYAHATHIKTFEFDAQGNETTVDVPKAMHYLLDAGYKGVWGIESCPAEGEDEIEAARKTIALIKRTLSEA